MVSDLRNRSQIEHFLRNASAEELLEQRDRIPDLRTSIPDVEAERFAARIAYELRFRLPQAV